MCAVLNGSSFGTDRAHIEQDREDNVFFRLDERRGGRAAVQQVGKKKNLKIEWLIRKHGAFEIGRKELGLSSKD